MPPKKKKTAVSPVVVGTVSTRSTRRQSVVNIDIPKSNKPPTKTAFKGQSEEVIREYTDVSAADNFSQKIKQSYNKMFSKILKPSIKTSLISSTKVHPKENCNKALLQILEDWTDDESQDHKMGNSESENGSAPENSQDAVDHNINESSDSDLVCSIQRSTVKEEVDTEIISEPSLNQYDSSIEIQECTQKEIKMETEELSKDSSGETEVIQEYVIEENSVPIEEHIEEVIEFEEENIVECVTEEIITDENDQFVLMDTVEEDTVTVLAGHQVTTIPEPINKSVNGTPQNLEETTKTKEIVETVEETSQSVSTTDSNDAEVRSFFVKEIENNETVNEEDIPTAGCEAEEQSSSGRENSDSLGSTSEENVETLVETRNSAVVSDEYLIESGTNSNCSEVVNDSVLDKICEDSNKLSLSEPDIKENCENKSFVEPMDTTQEVQEETIESKVAMMHLMDESVKEEDTSDELSEVFNASSVDIKYHLREDIEEVIGVKASRRYSSSLSEIKMEEEEMQSKVEDKVSINSGLLKEESKIQEPSELKSTTVKSKEKKSKPKESKHKESKSGKESKVRKKVVTPPVKKSKDKTEKKDSGRTDKKESTKKSSKFDNDHLKKFSKFDSGDTEDIEVRRSSRIKSISVLKKKVTGHGLVRSKSEPLLNEYDNSDNNSNHTESEKSTPSASPKVSTKDKKNKSSRSSENLLYESNSTTDMAINKNQVSEVVRMDVDEKPKIPAKDPVVTARLKQFIHLKENLYKTDRMTCKEAKKMTCDCFLTSEEIESNEFGCGEDCLNRLLLIECGSLCQVGDRCTNKRFQKGQFAPVEVFNTEKKGLGLRAAANIPYGEFILEYVGEVLNCDEFDKRAEVYSQDKNIHYYFMSLRADAIIDATVKGNISRFINHSCDPNAETQKWTVNGELRIGFFSTRTILAGEEITFDYRFQRYGKEAQKCYCEAAICRGWLGEQPDEDSDEEDEEEDEEEETEEGGATVKMETSTPELEKKKVEVETKMDVFKDGETTEVKVEKTETETTTSASTKRKSPRKKPRKDLFEELDQLDEEIDMLVTTGLKNQAHTLKLSRLMVRAKEPPQRTKLLRILRRGELPCRRLFLDYHGLRLMHGYMIDAQHLVHSDKKYESLRLEVLQTLAVLPIPNKTMLQDSKVLPTVEKWAADKDLGSPQDSDSNSPKNESEVSQSTTEETTKEQMKKITEPNKEDEKLVRSIEDQEEEIKYLATKLLEGWRSLQEVFRIPKKERIEQMKEHEREANKKYMQSSYSNEPDSTRKSDRYRHLSRYRTEREVTRKGSKFEEKPSAEYIRLSKIERRKLFALQHELKEEERRLKQRELWRQHELNCLLIGTDPRFTAPFDPSGGYQCIWNPQIGQWQNYSLPTQNQMVFSAQTSNSSVSMGTIPNINMPPPQLQVPKSIPNYPYSQQIPIATSLGHVQSQQPGNMTPMHIQTTPQGTIQMNALQGIPGALPQNIPTHSQIPTSIPAQVQLPYQDQEEDPSQVKFLGPIPPPAKLPPKWKCAKDKYGRPYYYHVKLRKSQWEPPPFIEPAEDPDESSESESSSDTSSLSSDTSTENSDSDDDIDDTRLLMEVRKQMEKSAKMTTKTAIPDHVKTEEIITPSPEDKNSEEDIEIDEEIGTSFVDEETERPSIDMRLKEQFNLLKDDNPPKKKRRVGLCEEIMISPRSEEDRLQFKEDLKRYKANKEKLKRQKELILQQTRKQLRESDSKKTRDKRTRAMLKTRIKEMPDFNSEQAKKIKENFRSNMASTVVGSLNAYRKPDCKEGRITNTEDFKHLARKLTHFVMLKEMKHIEKIEDLTCTDNVKSKAREYIKKYMSKFGEMYVKRNDSPDFKD